MRPCLRCAAALLLLAACDDKGGATDTGDAADGTDGSDGSDGSDGVDGVDADADGYDTPEDCDDTNPDIHPDADEAFNGMDDDCSGAVDDNLPHWGYESSEEEVGPEEWATWWPACEGSSQSPIDIDTSLLVEADRPDLDLDYDEVALEVENNGHTLEWKLETGGTLTLDGTTYDLLQFHGHAESEHLVDGVSFPLELHFVHRDDKGTTTPFDDEYAVIGFVVLEGSENEVFAAIGWDDLPAEHGEALVDPTTTFDPGGLMPEAFRTNQSSLRYEGSLTTPPCLETVHWILSEYPIVLSAAQIQAFTDIYDSNFRAPQGLNGRTVYLDQGL